MNKAILFNFLVNKEANEIIVERSFDAPLAIVWKAWTDAEILDQWWAPKPWRAETKSMDFREGGRWHYCMVSPDNTERHWCLFDYKSIRTAVEFSGEDAFCDEQQVENDTKPRVQWHNHFSATSAAETLVKIKLQFLSLADLEQIIAMGFKEGFTMGLGNLDALLPALKNQQYEK